jgi:hypothetical protein
MITRGTGKYARMVTFRARISIVHDVCFELRGRVITGSWAYVTCILIVLLVFLLLLLICDFLEINKFS